MVTARPVATGVDLPYITSVTPDQMGLARQINTIVNRVQQELASIAQAVNNLPPGNLNSGINASSSTFWRGDGTWAAPSVNPNFVVGPGASTVGDAVTWNNTAGTLVADTSWTTITQTKLTLFSSSQQGVVPSSSGFAVSTAYLGGDVAWHNLPAAPTLNFVLLNTLTASNSANLQDTTSLTATYSKYLVVFDAIIPATNAASFTMLYQVSSSFQVTGYVSIGGGTTAIALSSASGIANVAPGLSGFVYIHNPSANQKTITEGTELHRNGGSNSTAGGQIGGWWDTAGVVTGLEFLMSSGNITSGTIKIYGIT